MVMAASDPLQILLAHNEWATRQILQACAALSAEQFHRQFEMGPGSLHATTTHMLMAMQTWTDVLNQKTPRPRLDKDGTVRTPAQLLGMLDQTCAELAAVARAHPLEETVTRVRDGKTFTFTRGVVLTHVTTHGVHHRAQCLNMLRHLGAEPLPPSAVTEWARITGS
jgi:uncharacterized damage-inducible protein DinB